MIFWNALTNSIKLPNKKAMFQLNRIGLDTAKSVLALNREELVRRTDLEEETVEGVLTILRREFE